MQQLKGTYRVGAHLLEVELVSPTINHLRMTVKRSGIDDHQTTFIGSSDTMLDAFGYRACWTIASVLYGMHKGRPACTNSELMDLQQLLASFLP